MKQNNLHIFTLADQSQLKDLPQNGFIKGHAESRIAVVGRSNVGKSSLINALLRAQVAKTSSQPGKTRAIYFYLWKTEGKIIVDLPGYGYATASKVDRNRWEELISSYLAHDKKLKQVLLLLDARHGPTDLDLQAIEFFRAQNISLTFVMAKADTLKTQSQRALRQREVSQLFSQLGYATQQVFWTSSETRLGLKQLVESLSML